MTNWVKEFDISKLTPETRNLLIQLSDAAPEAELSTFEQQVPFRDPSTGEEGTAIEWHTRPTEPARKWSEAREALMSCAEPELRIHTEKLNISLSRTEFSEFAESNPNDLVAQRSREREIVERMKDLEHDLHKLGLRIKDGK
jgi:hypothetical protein